MNAHQQSELVLAPRDTNDILHDRLAAAVEDLNATTDPAERVEIFTRVQRLRRALGLEGGAP